MVKCPTCEEELYSKNPYTLHACRGTKCLTCGHRRYAHSNSISQDGTLKPKNGCEICEDKFRLGDIKRDNLCTGFKGLNPSDDIKAVW